MCQVVKCIIVLPRLKATEFTLYDEKVLGIQSGQSRHIKTNSLGSEMLNEKHWNYH